MQKFHEYVLKTGSVYVTSHVDPIVALLVSSFDFEVFSETDIMNMISEDQKRKSQVNIL